MAKGQIHLTPEGPANCNADPTKPGAKGCPYSASGHYDSSSQAEQAYEELLESTGVDHLRSSSSSLTELKADIAALASRGDAPKLEELQTIGAKLEEEILSRTGIEIDRKDISAEELKTISIATSALLKEIQGEDVALRSKFHGPFAKQLKEALEPIPTGAAYLVYGDVHTETVNSRNSSRDGFHIHQAAVMSPAPLGTKSFMSVSPSARRGDLVVDNSIAYRSEIENGEIQGFAVSRIERGIGEPLKDGDSVLHAIRQNRADDKFIDLLKVGALDTDGVILPGGTEHLKELAPELVKSAEEVAVVSSFYAGDKPTGAIARGKRYRKVAKEFEVKDAQGESYTVAKDLYEIQEKSLSYKDHTIATKRYGGDTEAQNTVLLHEFSHAVQSARRNGIPGEKEIFQEIYPKGERIKADGYEHFSGFPDDYMGDIGGKEVFPRATEAIFYPHTSDNGYLYDGSERSEDVRRWVLGAWATLGAEGLRAKKSV